MTRSALLKFAASGLIAAIGIGAPSTIVVASDGDAPVANPARAASSAGRATQMMQRGRADRAVGYAEEAVALSPYDPAHRSLLGQAYLATGRFASAEASFDAARQLGASDTRTIIGHALSLVANNRANEALALIEAHGATLPASDLGLALALAGQPERGALVLIDVVRAGDSTPRDRQNLALAYAMAGRWLEARLTAVQDLGPAHVNSRIEQWAAMIQATDPRTRIAGLFGATPVADPGMPVHLALVGGRATGLAMAGDPAPLALYAPAPSAENSDLVAAMLSDAASRGNSADSTESVVPFHAPQPFQLAAPAGSSDNQAALVFVSNPVIQPLRAMVAMVAPLQNRSRSAPVNAVRNARPTRIAGANLPVAAAPAAATPTGAAPVAVPLRVAAASGPVRTSGWVVQLGAFNTLAAARDNWVQMSRRHAALASSDGVSTSATVRGRTFHRLNATGFDSRAAAASACASIQSAGGTCFTRSLPASERVQWASRPLSTRVATR